MKTKYVMYIDYKGLLTHRNELTTFEIEHLDDGLDGILEAQEHVEGLTKHNCRELLDPIKPAFLELDWSRDICVYEFECWIAIDAENPVYELFNVSITEQKNIEWIKEFIKDDYYSGNFQQLAKIVEKL